jgi:hypothetical protein
MFMLKLVTEPGSAATCNVSVAGTTAPAANVVVSLFQVSVKTELAAAGVHCVAVMFSVSAVLPEFLM